MAMMELFFAFFGILLLGYCQSVVYRACVSIKKTNAAVIQSEGALAC